MKSSHLSHNTADDRRPRSSGMAASHSAPQAGQQSASRGSSVSSSLSSSASDVYVSPRDSADGGSPGRLPRQKGLTSPIRRPHRADQSEVTAVLCGSSSPSSFSPSSKTPGDDPRGPPEMTAMPPSPSPPLSFPAESPPPPRTHFQYIHHFDTRRRLAAKMRGLYGAEFIPVIVEPAESHLRLASPPPPSPQLLHHHSSRDRQAGLLGQRGWAVSSSGQGERRTDGRATAASAPLPPAALSALASPSTRSTIKCVLPSSKSVAEIILTLRDRLALDSCQSIFLSVGESDALVPGNSLLGDLYQRYRNPDGFLYLSYLLENTFG